MALNRTKSNIYGFFLTVICLFVLFSFTVYAYTPQYLDETKNTQLRWKSSLITVGISTSLYRSNTNVKTDSDVYGVLSSSLESWQSVANVKFIQFLTDKQTVSPSGISGDGISLITNAQTPENLLLFAGDTKTIPARTRVFFNKKGHITEADIVLNPYQQFSTDGTFGTFDLESVITHELGHLLGLEHSAVNGSTMFTHIGINGVYSMANFAPRTLSDDDISGIRSIYGTDDIKCCGSIHGKLSLKSGKPASKFLVWAEETESGKISAGVLTNAEGNYQIEGLSIGKYRLFAQDKNKHSKISAEEIDEIILEKGKTTKFNKKLTNKSKKFSFDYIGFNAQLAKQVIPVNNGKSFTLFLGGYNIDFHDTKIKTNSPYFKILPNSIIKHDFDNGLDVFSFEIQVIQDAEYGDFSLQIQSSDESNDFFVGSMTIDKYFNNYGSRLSFITE